MKNRVLLIVFSLLMVAFLFTGCGAPSAVSPELRDPEAIMAAQYGSISPLNLNPDLTGLQLQRMRMPMHTLIVHPWQPPDGPFSLPREDYYRRQADDLDAPVDPEKAYLQGKWLLNQAEGTTRKDLYEQAVDELSLGLTADPCNASLMELLAQAYYLTGNDQYAKELCYETLRRNPQSLKTWSLLADLLDEAGNQEQASVALRHALKSPDATPRNPLTAMVHLQWAAVLDRQGYLAAAGEQYQQAWELFLQQRSYAQASPKVTRLISQLHIMVLAHAYAELRVGNVAAAYQLLSRAENLLEVENGQFMLAFLLTLSSQKVTLDERYRMIRAMVQYQLVVEPDMEQVLSMFYRACKNMAAYQNYLEDIALWLTPRAPGERPLLTPRLYARGLALAEQINRAIAYLEQLSKNNPNDIMLYYDLAHLYQRQLEWPAMLQAAAAYLDGLKDEDTLTDNVSPILQLIDKSLLENNLNWQAVQKWSDDNGLVSSSGGLFLLGYLAEQFDQSDSAVGYYARVIKRNERFLPARRRLIQNLLERQHFEEAISYVIVDREDPAALWMAAQASEGAGNLQQAVDYYRRLLEFQEDNLGVYLALSRVLALQGHYKSAEQILLKIHAEHVNDINVIHHLLTLYVRWGVDEASTGESLQNRFDQRCRELFDIWEQGIARFGETERVANWLKLIQNVQSLYKAADRKVLPGKLLLRAYMEAGMDDKAVQYADRLLEQLPEHPEIMLAAARLYQNRDEDKALNLRRRIWQTDSGNAEYLLEYVRALRRSLRLERAVKTLNEHVDPASHFDTVVTARRWLNEATQIFFMSRHYNEAEMVFSRWRSYIENGFSETSPEEKTQLLRLAHENLVWAQIESGRFDQAVASAIKLYEAHSDQSLLPGMWLVRTLNIRLKFDLSEELLDNLMQLHAEDHSLRTLYYETLLQQDKTEQALFQAHQWWQEKPYQKIRLRIYIAILREAGDYRQLRDLFDQELADGPGLADLTLQWIDILLEMGKLDAAEELLVKYAPAPDDSYLWFEAWVKLELARGRCDNALRRAERFVDLFKSKVSPEPIQANIYHLCGKLQEAADLQKSLMEADPCDLETAINYCVFLDELEQTDKAVAMLEQLLRDNPGNPGLMNNLGYILVENDMQIEKARQLLEDSLLLDPRSAATLDSMGWLHYKSGEFDKAAEYIYKSAAMMVSPDFEILDHLGDIMYRLGRRDNACLYWQRALKQLRRRFVVEKYLQKHIEGLETKVQACEAGNDVKTAPVWAGQLPSGR